MTKFTTYLLVKLLLLLSNILSGPWRSAIVLGLAGHGCSNISESGPLHRLQVDFSTAAVHNGRFHSYLI